MGIFLKLKKKDYSNCKSYVYKSGNGSTLDKIFNVYWNFCVRIIPKSVSANLLTLLGFLCSTIAFFLMHIFDTLDKKYDYIYLCVALFIFLYQTLDAIDGKQARRTNTSSPLGQLFDHGCDSITASLFIFIIGKVTDLPKGLLFYAMLSLIQFETYLFSWLEYHTKVYSTSIGQFGTTEANVCAMLMCIIRAFKGVGIFNITMGDMLPEQISNFLFKDILSLKLNVVILVTSFLIITGIAFTCIYLGLQRAKKIKEAISQLVVFSIFIFIQYYLYQSYLTSKYELLCLLIISLYSSIYTLHMNLYSVLKIKMQMLPHSTIFYYISILILFLKHNTKCQFLNQAIFKDIHILYCMLLFVVIYLLDYANTIITNVCKELNINFLFNKKTKTK